MQLQAKVGRYANSSSKLYLGENRVAYWSTHDEHQIMINGTGYNVVYSNDGNAVIENVTNSDDGFSAIYPADIVSSMSRSSAIITLPAVQDYTTVNGKQQLYSPMAAYTSGTTLSLQNLCSLLCISIANPTSEPFVMKEITVATANCSLCGRATVTIDETSTISMDAPTSSTKSVSLSFLAMPDTIAVGETKDYYVIVPPFTSDDLTVGIVGNTPQNNYTWKKQASGKTLPSNMIARGPQATSDFIATTLIGSGTAASPYLIANCNDLTIMRNVVNTQNSTYGSAYYKLIYDIDCDTITHSPIGKNVSNAFMGHFDGNNHSITIRRVMPVVSLGDAYVGLFGVVSGSAIVENTTLHGIINAEIQSGTTTNIYVGGVCALCSRETVSFRNLTNYATIVVAAASVDASGSMCIGGICGQSVGMSTQCVNHADMRANCSGTLFAGGIVGQLKLNTAGTNISNCGNTGSIEGISSSTRASYASQYRNICVGGIVGLWGDYESAKTYNCKIINSFNNGDLTATATNTTKDGCACCGGIVGGTLLTTATIGNCYNTGIIQSEQNTAQGLSAGILAGGALQSTQNRIEVVMNTTTPICRTTGGGISAGAGIVASGKGAVCQYAAYSAKTVNVDGVSISASEIPASWPHNNSNITASTDELTLSTLNGLISQRGSSDYTTW
ncbi:MAG: hypothetical protein IJ761_06005 [Bacteroidales bacterium]|nr:hypothetical protein [Bacteroidales bacterium]MBR1799435.1 hypothetical protein [Bacteroidales bacterium]